MNTDITSGDIVTGKCATCGRDIYHLGGPSWRHLGRIGGDNHSADPDEATRAALAQGAR